MVEDIFSLVSNDSRSLLQSFFHKHSYNSSLLPSSDPPVITSTVASARLSCSGEEVESKAIQILESPIKETKQHHDGPAHNIEEGEILPSPYRQPSPSDEVILDAELGISLRLRPHNAPKTPMSRRRHAVDFDTPRSMDRPVESSESDTEEVDPALGNSDHEFEGDEQDASLAQNGLEKLEL